MYPLPMELRSIEAIVSALNNANVQYLIVGGLAVNAHGFVRMTRDIDIVLALTPENAAKGLNTLLAIGYNMSIPESAEDFANPGKRDLWRNEKHMIVLKLWSDEHRRTPIDIFVYEPFDFATELKASTSLEIAPNILAPVVSLETLLQMKRMADRPQDRLDIEELLRVR